MTESDNTGRQRTAYQFDIKDRPATLAVIESVASVKDEDPLELPPLGHHTDSEALNQFVANTVAGTIRFSYAGFDIEITSAGELTVSERSG